MAVGYSHNMYSAALVGIEDSPEHLVRGIVRGSALASIESAVSHLWCTGCKNLYHVDYTTVVGVGDCWALAVNEGNFPCRVVRSCCNSSPPHCDEHSCQGL